MTDKEFETVVVAIKAAYPRFNALPDKYAIRAWYRMLADMDFEVVENAVLEHISTSAFPPSIAEIRKLCVERYKKAPLGFDGAWNVVLAAIAKHGLNGFQEAFGMMDPLTLDVVKNLGWRNLCLSENQAADRANFREAYEAKVKALQVSRQLPEFVVKDKALLQKRHMPAVEEKTVVKIPEKPPERWQVPDLTEEQIEKRLEMVEAVRRQVFGGEKTE